jgi:hypothetical protein
MNNKLKLYKEYNICLKSDDLIKTDVSEKNRQRTRFG